MKKITVLLSILALAACGGGSGGTPVDHDDTPVIPGDTTNTPDNGNNTGDNNQTDNNSNQDDNNPPTINPVDILNPDMLSNLSNINDARNMFRDFDYKFTFDDNGNVISFQLLDEGDTEPLTLNRQGLDTRRFVADRTLYYFDIPVRFADNSYTEFSLEDLDQEYTDREQLAQIVRTEMERRQNDGELRYTDELINDVCDRIRTDSSYGTWESVLWQGDFYTLGKENGLRYSDFGHFTLDDYAYSVVYHGGIESKKIDPSTMRSMGRIEFNGSAAAQLQHSYEVNGEDVWENQDNSHGNRLITTAQGAAKLTFDNGTETLNMPFTDWYTVNVEKSGNYASRVDFTNGDTVPENWRVMNEHVVYDRNTAGIDYHDDRLPEIWGSGTPDTNVWTNTGTAVETIYYGDNDIPTEATGFVNHVDEYDDLENNTERTIWFDAVFGGKKPE